MAEILGAARAPHALSINQSDERSNSQVQGPPRYSSKGHTSDSRMKEEGTPWRVCSECEWRDPL